MFSKFITLTLCHPEQPACHPERSKPIRLANRFTQSKDPFHLRGPGGLKRNPLQTSAVKTPLRVYRRVKRKGILRLHENLASRDSHSAQDDKSLKFLRPRLLRVGIIIKPAARFAPVPARHHQPLQQRR